MRRAAAGFSLPELLVVLVLVGMVTAGIGSVFSSQQRAYRREDRSVALEENLRIAAGMVGDSLRNAGCGTPSHSLSIWIPWASGFDDAPVAVLDGGTDPDTLSVAACTTTLAKVDAYAAAGATTLSLASVFPETSIAELFNDEDRSLIWIDNRQHARVTSVSGDTVTIDTDPTTGGDQGLWRAQQVGTPIARVDVNTFRIGKDSATGLSRLELDKHRGTPFVAADSIVDLRVTTLEARRRYRVTLTGQAEIANEKTGAQLSRSVDVEISLRN